MRVKHAKVLIQSLLDEAGITVNGNQPWDIQVHNDHFFVEALLGGSLQVGESYVAKWWDCTKLDEFFSRVLRSSVNGKIPASWKDVFYHAWSRILNFRSARQSIQDIARHYDLGNDLFKAMLDQRLLYTCGYWKDATTLDEAQERKLDLTCKKLYLQPGMRMLDVGCGWGGLARFVAEKYDVHVTGITLSEKQAKYAQDICKDLPVDIKLLDYRHLHGRYDRIVSLGMLEHVGYRNYRTYMQIVNNHLEDNGLFLLHTIGSNISCTDTDPWLNKYIFPNSLIPSIAQIAKAAERRFVVEDWHNFSADYDKTLMAWYHNFVSRWDELKKNYTEEFYRIWTYYLLSCAGSFRARKNQLWQIVFSKNGMPGGYVSVR